MILEHFLYIFRDFTVNHISYGKKVVYAGSDFPLREIAPQIVLEKRIKLILYTIYSLTVLNFTGAEHFRINASVLLSCVLRLLVKNFGNHKGISVFKSLRLGLEEDSAPPVEKAKFYNLA